jgi:hypothetical protein
MQAKPDYPALLSPGIHNATLDEVFLSCVQPFSPHAQREQLWARFLLLIQRLQVMGLSGCAMWLDGSFITRHPNPADIDCALWVEQTTIDGMDDATYAALEELKNRPMVRSMYGADFYILPAGYSEQMAHFQQVFGVCHDGVTAKGFYLVLVP